MRLKLLIVPEIAKKEPSKPYPIEGLLDSWRKWMKQEGGHMKGRHREKWKESKLPQTGSELLPGLTVRVRAHTEGTPSWRTGGTRERPGIA